MNAVNEKLWLVEWIRPLEQYRRCSNEEKHDQFY